MFGVLSAALLSLDQICMHFATALHQSEPQVFVFSLIAALFWFLFFPPRNDPDEV